MCVGPQMVSRTQTTNSCVQVSVYVYCVQALSEGLRNNQTIVELNLSGCNLTDEAVKVLASIIKVCSHNHLTHCQNANGRQQCR